MPKTTHGGKREGAGRKPTGPSPFRRLVVFIAPEHEQLLREMGDGHISLGLRTVLEERFNGASWTATHRR